jgi:NADH-quinone oxidoreductase subunit B
VGVDSFYANRSGFIATRLDTVVNKVTNWGRQNSLWPYPFATACCGIEFMGVVSNVHDVSRFGAELVRFAPKQADLLVVAGTINHKMAPILKRIYDQMLEPKWVIAFGVCAASGGFYDNYAVVQGIDHVIPVDVYLPGCPPRPEAFFEALVLLQKKIQGDRGDVYSQERVPQMAHARAAMLASPAVRPPG